MKHPAVASCLQLRTSPLAPEGRLLHSEVVSPAILLPVTGDSAMFTPSFRRLSNALSRRRGRTTCVTLGLWSLAAAGSCQAQPADPTVDAGGVPSVYALQPESTGNPALHDDPSLRIMVGTQSLPLSFSLIQRESEWGAWADASFGPVMPRGALARGLPPVEAVEPAVRLWIPMHGSGQRMRFTHAYVNLSRPTLSDGDLQVRPGAGVVMQLGGSTGYLQQLSLGSVFRLNMGEGSQVALRLKGGRLGVQYRLQFNL